MTKKLILIYSLFGAVLLTTLFVSGCSKLNDNIASAPSELMTHKAGIVDTSSADFHGRLLKSGTWKLTGCVDCHGTTLSGGPVAPSCRSCHANAGGHKTGIATPSSPNFHGSLISSGAWEMIDCQTCHGADLKGNSIAPSCYSCHAIIGGHEAGIIDPTSPNFHGTLLKSGSWTLLSCQACHGTDLSGGANAPSCRSCHSNAGGHKTGIATPSSPNFHGALLLAGTWSMTDCKTCHGTDLKGGSNAPSCYSCHSNFGGHDVGIIDPNSANFHGTLIKNGSWQLADCKACHGTDLRGGAVAPSCASCHLNAGGHLTGLLDPNSVNFHGKLVINNGWSFSECQKCHGTNLTGGTNGPSCSVCHNDPDGVKGTNPRIHPSGYMHNTEGNWHNNQNYFCYSCHTGSPNGTAGQGFCGYCHGAEGD